MNRRDFFKTSSVIGAGLIIAPNIIFGGVYHPHKHIYAIDLPIGYAFYIRDGVLYQYVFSVFTYKCNYLSEFTNRFKDKAIFIYDYNQYEGYVRAAVIDIPLNELVTTQLKPYYENKSYI